MLKEFVRVFFSNANVSSARHKRGDPLFSLVSNLGQADRYRVLNWKFVIWRNYNVERICATCFGTCVFREENLYLNLNAYIHARYFFGSLPLLFNDF